MANINKELNDIKNAVYGKEVRGSIHDGIKKINEEVENTTDRQDSVEAQFQSVLDETTGKDVISAPEITAARVGSDNTNYPNLKERLDTEYQKLSSQLEQIVINVKTFGALGDGVTDDSDAILDAIAFLKNMGGGRLYFPKGIYMISKTLYLPSNITVEGAGRNVSIIKAYPDVLFDDYEPHPNSPNRNIYRTMITTESVGINNPIEEVQNINIMHIGIDWNGCITEENGIVRANAPLWIDRAKEVTLYDVEIYDALPAEFVQWNNRSSGCSILFSWAKDCVADRCILHSAEYESLSVRYLSENIIFKNGVIHAVHNNTHAVQLARPTVTGLNGVGPFYFINNKVYVHKTKDAIAAHEGNGFFVIGNTFKYVPHPDSQLQGMINAFDYCKNVNIKDNYIDLSEWDQAKPVAGIFLGGIHMNYAGIYDGIISNNVIDVRFPIGNYKQNLKDWLAFVNHPIAGDIGLAIAPVIGGARNLFGNVNVVIEGNLINVLEFPNQPLNIISFSGFRSSITNNQVRLIDALEPLTEESAPTIIKIVGGYNLTVSGNRGGTEDKFRVGINLTPSDSHGNPSSSRSIRNVLITNNEMLGALVENYYAHPTLDIENVVKSANMGDSSND